MLLKWQGQEQGGVAANAACSYHQPAFLATYHAANCWQGQQQALTTPQLLLPSNTDRLPEHPTHNRVLKARCQLVSSPLVARVCRKLHHPLRLLVLLGRRRARGHQACSYKHARDRQTQARSKLERSEELSGRSCARGHQACNCKHARDGQRQARSVGTQ